MQDQEILRHYKINFDFHWAWTGKDDILHMGANLHVQNQEMLQLYKMNFDFHLAKTGKDDIMRIRGLICIIACSRSGKFCNFIRWNLTSIRQEQVTMTFSKWKYRTKINVSTLRIKSIKSKSWILSTIDGLWTSN